jgi:hypothetical protein
MSTANYTAKELELLDLLLTKGDDPEKHARFIELKKVCAWERFARSNPGWRENLKEAHAEQRKVVKRYWGLIEELEGQLGEREVRDLTDKLNRGEEI